MYAAHIFTFKCYDNVCGGRGMRVLSPQRGVAIYRILRVYRALSRRFSGLWRPRPKRIRYFEKNLVLTAGVEGEKNRNRNNATPCTRCEAVARYTIMFYLCAPPRRVLTTFVCSRARVPDTSRPEDPGVPAQQVARTVNILRRSLLASRAYVKRILHVRTRYHCNVSFEWRNATPVQDGRFPSRFPWTFFPERFSEVENAYEFRVLWHRRRNTASGTGSP